MITHLPGSSRVWFFGANRVLTDFEKQDLHEKLSQFIVDWKAHGSDLSAGFEILHDVAVLIAVDESKAAASGCSIDKAFNLLKSSEIDFFQRMLVWQPFCNTAKILTIEDVRESIAQGTMDAHTQILNPMVQDLNDARSNLYIPISMSWVYPKVRS